MIRSTILLIALAVHVAAAAQTSPFSKAQLRAAADYSRDSGGLSLLVLHNGNVVFEEYQNGHTATKAHRLASGTKSFWGAAAAAAIDDGLITLDERVADTITEWKSDKRKSKITVAHLLHLTSGLDTATRELRGPLRVKNKYAFAVELEAYEEPGSVFEYGPGHFFAFGEFMRRKLAKGGETPYEYLTRRILEPIGLEPTRWSTDRSGNYLLPFGAFLTAREWAKFGELVRLRGAWQGKQIVSWEALSQCFQGSEANPSYGLTFWLNANGTGSNGRARKTLGKAPADMVMAAGSGSQRLYIIPSMQVVIVRQGESRLFRDVKLLENLLE